MKDLLLLLSKYPSDKNDQPALSMLLKQVTDWSQLTGLINAHGIIALAAYNIKVCGLEREIPVGSMAILENGYLQSVVRNEWLTERWREVNQILCEAVIEHILLKGMALEHTLYGSRGLRQMTDTDILIKREDCMRAWNLLQQKGFISEQIKSPLHKKIIIDIGKHLPTLYKNGYAVEIHHKLWEDKIPGLQETGDLFKDAIEIDIRGTKALILSREMQLKHLIDHFEKHAREGGVQFRQYADIILLDKTSKLTMPEKFILDPRQEKNQQYLKEAWRATVRSIPSRYKLRFVIGDIFPSLKWMKNRYKSNSSRALIYYPVRLGKLLWMIRAEGSK